MVATDDFLKPFTATHDLDDESAGLRMPFPFVDEISFFDAHYNRSRVT
jgi:hypothetical protein